VTYADFLARKAQLSNDNGFEPLSLPDWLFPFQSHLVEWALRRGRAAIFADCGLGKTPMQLVWAENVVRKTNGRVLILTPLAVTQQTIRESEKFDIECGRSTEKIVVSNYEKLHYFNPSDFIGVVCDESSAIKHFSGARQREVTEFMRKTQYRLLCSATPAPNDFIELGTAAEALGQMGRMDMLGTFFKNDENSLHPIWWGARWRFKKHAERDFWRWVCSWARALRKPSDLGFEDTNFNLPPLVEEQHVVKRIKPLSGTLFQMQAVGLAEERQERRETMPERCERVAELVNGHAPAAVWCHLNPEGDLLEKLIPGSVQIAGNDSDDKKEKSFVDFARGKIRVIITKPQIGGFGLNWQHCAHMTFFPSHSWEQYYQAVRRCWRFGQKNSVKVDIVTTEGELRVLANLQRKSTEADKMYDKIVEFMSDALNIRRISDHDNAMEQPKWLR